MRRSTSTQAVPPHALRRGATALNALLTVALAASATLLAAEVGLRAVGGRPGVIASARFELHDEVRLVKGLIADDQGIMKYDATMRGDVARLIAGHSPRPIVDDVLRGYESSIRYLVASFARSDPQLAYDDPFVRMIDRIEGTPERQRTALERAYLEYAKTPIDSDGFRSIELADHGTSKGKILLLGDSFAFGYSAEPLTASFADRLAAAGYAVYNTGIPAVGPAQYEKIAAEYIPRLRPDVVVVNFYMANDVVFWETKLEPFQFQQYPTDVGFFSAEPRGEYLRSPQEAYDYAVQYYRIPGRDRLLNRLCATTVLGTKLWSALANAGTIDPRAARFVAYDERNARVEEREPVSERHIARIKTMTEEYGGKFLLMAITDPLNTTGSAYTPADVFKTVEYHVPDVGQEGYRPAPDAHFNNEGHRKYAEQITRLIEQSRSTSAAVR